jgi:hypothetical protein
MSRQISKSNRDRREDFYNVDDKLNVVCERDEFSVSRSARSAVQARPRSKHQSPADHFPWKRDLAAPCKLHGALGLGVSSTVAISRAVGWCVGQSHFSVEHFPPDGSIAPRRWRVAAKSLASPSFQFFEASGCMFLRCKRFRGVRFVLTELLSGFDSSFVASCLRDESGGGIWE